MVCEKQRKEKWWPEAVGSSVNNASTFFVYGLVTLFVEVCATRGDWAKAGNNHRPKRRSDNRKFRNYKEEVPLDQILLKRKRKVTKNYFNSIYGKICYFLN